MRTLLTFLLLTACGTREQAAAEPETHPAVRGTAADDTTLDARVALTPPVIEAPTTLAEAVVAGDIAAIKGFLVRGDKPPRPLLELLLIARGEAPDYARGGRGRAA